MNMTWRSSASKHLKCRKRPVTTQMNTKKSVKTTGTTRTSRLPMMKTCLHSKTYWNRLKMLMN